MTDTATETTPQKTDTGGNFFPFRSLGFDHGTYYFMSSRSCQVLAFSGRSLTKNSLMELAPLRFWEDNFAGGKGVQWDLAIDSVIGLCEQVGSYDPGRIRGRGAWFDQGRTVIHLGNKIYCSGDLYELTQFNTKYIYESGAALPLPDFGKLDYTHLFKLAEINRSLNFSDKTPGKTSFNADLLTGWLVVSTVCGALDWRPHLWLTGLSGSGKSWILDNIVRKILGKQVIEAIGKSSEAGVRQAVNGDALPIVFEEAGDRKGKNDFFEMQDMLFLARQSSTEGGGNILKGSKDQKGRSFKMRNCWLFASINVHIQDAADESRITVIQLNANNRPGDTEKFKLLKEVVFSTLTPSFCSAFRAMAIERIPTIRENAAIFSHAAAKVLNSQRLGDQIGTLCAGFWALVQPHPVTPELAEEYLLTHSLDEQKRTSQIKDEELCIQTILQSITECKDSDFNSVKPTIFEVILKATGRPANLALSEVAAQAHLSRLGMKVEDNFLWLQNNHDGIKKLLKETPYYSGYALLLSRIDGHKGGRKRIIQGANPVHVAGIPLSYIIDDKVE